MSGDIAGERAGVGALAVADWLSLSGAPVFAIMALLTATNDGGPAGRLCGGAGQGLSPSGMTLMYLLMFVIHVAAWLRLISRKSQKRPHGPPSGTAHL
ncbi:MAG: hypothetical protein JHC57_02055 [Sphingopyxis sp.]|uniref:hypothetical protein n=1 Tax=Sphingopyxis sp. TaxID=1908224 RepID=UPI001A338C0F|nr:hypothetical protein [Sphingopyxis sp.]MBJ7498517.1 hypothetical protein [Sphingopyxis sp.]